ncbi:MAG: hypothetical protein SWY16_02145 [Cyanobacteriota bacterium]|nr:hypothetical protein [Cyanobacteriota bacterium]
MKTKATALLLLLGLVAPLGACGADEGGEVEEQPAEMETEGEINTPAEAEGGEGGEGEEGGEGGEGEEGGEGGEGEEGGEGGEGGEGEEGGEGGEGGEG